MVPSLKFAHQLMRQIRNIQGFASQGTFGRAELCNMGGGDDLNSVSFFRLFITVGKPDETCTFVYGSLGSL